MSLSNTIFLSNICEPSKAFCNHFGHTDQIKNFKTVLLKTDDFFSYSMIDILDAIGIVELPCVVWGGCMYTGVNAFDKMSELSGVPFTKNVNNLNSHIRDLRVRANTIACLGNT